LIEQSVTPSQREARDSRCGPLWHPLWQSKMEPASSRLKWLQQLLLPLPSARQHHWPEGTEGALQQVLQPLGLETRQLRVKFPRDSFFSKGDRAVWIVPSQLEYRFFRSVADKLDASSPQENPSSATRNTQDLMDRSPTDLAHIRPSRRLDLQLGFTLSRGCYATMLVKQLDGVAVDLAEDQNTDERSQLD
jgi:tRNA(Glu) U13 pseudouridine synthase TruD